MLCLIKIPTKLLLWTNYLGLELFLGKTIVFFSYCPIFKESILPHGSLKENKQRWTFRMSSRITSVAWPVSIFRTGKCSDTELPSQTKDGTFAFSSTCSMLLSSTRMNCQKLFREMRKNEPVVFHLSSAEACPNVFVSPTAMSSNKQKTEDKENAACQKRVYSVWPRTACRML